jgi:hypothetical protein
MTPADPTTLVSATPPAAPAAAVTAAPAAAAPAVDTAAYQRQIDELKEQVAEGQRTAQYWADKVKAGAPTKPAEAEDEPDVLEAITTGGAKGFDKLAKQRGFIQRDEVESLINQRAASLTEEQQLLKEYPDLSKKESEFFRATALEYGKLVKSGVPQAVAMGNAARQTELEFIKAGKIKLPAAAQTKEEKEAARVARIAAQSGDTGARRPAAADEEDEDLTAEQKHIADAMGISHEAYAKRAKNGVAMRGVK